MIDENMLIKFLNNKDVEMSLEYMKLGIPYHQYDKDYGCLFREIKEEIQRLKNVGKSNCLNIEEYYGGKEND